MLTLQYKEHGECISQELNAAFQGSHPFDLLLIGAGNETLHAHRLVLVAASPLIRTLLADPTIPNEGLTTIHFPDVSMYYFRLLLNFLYSGETWVPAYEVDNLHDLLTLLQMSDVKTLDSSKNDSIIAISRSTNEGLNQPQINCVPTNSDITVKCEGSTDCLSEEVSNEEEVNRMLEDKIVLEIEHPPEQENVELEQVLDYDSRVTDFGNQAVSGSQTKTNREFQCKYCDKQFDLLCSFRKHQLVHTDEKPFGCRLCPTKFAQKYNLVTHISFKHRNLPHLPNMPGQYKCCFCADLCVSREDLVRHLSREHRDMLRNDGTKRAGLYSRRSTPDLEYRCEYCGKLFSLLRYLRRHLLSHTGNQPFACRLCNATFLQKSNLLVHLCSKHRDVIRSSEAPDRYTCCFCFQLFESQKELTRHFPQQHNNLLLNENRQEILNS